MLALVAVASSSRGGKVTAPSWLAQSTVAVLTISVLGAISPSTWQLTVSSAASAPNGGPAVPSPAASGTYSSTPFSRSPHQPKLTPGYTRRAYLNKAVHPAA